MLLIFVSDVSQVARIFENHFLAGPGFWDLEKNQAGRAIHYLSIDTKIALGTLVRFWL